MTMSSKDHIAVTEEFSPRNYAPLGVVLSEGHGVWVTDVEGKRYLDLLSGYSALNFGHSNPRFIAAAKRQLDRLTLTSRAFYNDQFGLFCRDLAELSGFEMVLAMNSGTEAVETAIKAARQWGYQHKKVAHDEAEILCFSGNFAGRSVTIVSFSTEHGSRRDFGPYTPGFRVVPYGDADAVRAAITANTVAVLFEPVQGEAGVIIPPDGFLKELREICTTERILMISDEIQTGLGRAGYLLACEHEGVQPDMALLGKSLGGGIVPISAVLSSREVLSLFTPGSHGSTFGGNPFACAIAREVIAMFTEERPHERARALGEKFLAALRGIRSSKVAAVRGRGFMFGIDIEPSYGPAKKVCYELLSHGILTKDTRQETIRIAPPLIIEERDLEWALERIAAVLQD